jgi:hypothetical protein
MPPKRRASPKPGRPAKPRARRAAVASPVPAAPPPATRVEDLAAKLAKGGALSATERERASEALFEAVPTRIAEPMEPGDGEPPDLVCGSQRALAEACGVHQNTIGNWKKRGVEPFGEPPYSLKAYYLLLRRRGLLGDCKPRSKLAHELWAWCFGARGGEDATNPDDPTHAPPVGWSQEKERQTALAAKIQRQRLQVEVETLEGERIPTETVRVRLRDLVDQVTGVLAGFLAVPAQMPGLNPDQLADLSDLIQRAIDKAKEDLAAVRSGL